MFLVRCVCVRACAAVRRLDKDPPFRDRTVRHNFTVIISHTCMFLHIIIPNRNPSPLLNWQVPLIAPNCYLLMHFQSPFDDFLHRYVDEMNESGIRRISFNQSIRLICWSTIHLVLCDFAPSTTRIHPTLLAAKRREEDELQALLGYHASCLRIRRCSFSRQIACSLTIIHVAKTDTTCPLSLALDPNALGLKRVGLTIPSMLQGRLG